MAQKVVCSVLRIIISIAKNGCVRGWLNRSIARNDGGALLEIGIFRTNNQKSKGTMNKYYLAAFKLSSLILGTYFLLANATLAAENPTVGDRRKQNFPPGVNQYSQQTNPLRRVTSVSQLEDVQPTDWAYQALQSLIERYGIIVGYPDSTFRGNRAMTRYEFAAALNAALQRIEQSISSGSRNMVREEDLATLERLRRDFAPELAGLRSQIDTLASRTNFLEATQFSTTTKLNGVVTFNVVGASANGDVKVERIDPEDSGSAAGRGIDGQPIVTRVKDDPSLTFSYTTALILTTSFTGKDSLNITLLVGNGDSPANVYSSAGLFNTFGVPGTDFTPTTDANRLNLFEVFYSFPLNNSLRVVAGPRLLWLSYFDTNAFTSIFGKGGSAYNTFGSTLAQELGRGAGAVALWRLNEQFDLRFGYFSSLDASDPSTGLFNGTRAVTTQLTYSPNPNINLRFLYDRSRMNSNEGQVSIRPIRGVADDGFGGSLEDATSDAFVFNFDWLVTPKLGVFGRYSYAITQLNAANDGVENGNVKAQSVQLGIAFPDLGKRGALATISYVMPFDVLEGRRFLVAGGGNGGTQYEIELAYYFPLTENIAILPAFYIIGNPNNFDDNPTIFSGTVRTQFSF